MSVFGRLAPFRKESIFGGVDGLGLFLGLLAGMIVSHQPPRALWAAAVSGGVAEFINMANAQRVSDRKSGPLAAVVIGAASFAGCVVPAVPYSAWRGPGAVTVSLVLAVAMAGLISWLRPEKGLLAAIETYCLLIVTGVVCGVVGIWL